MALREQALLLYRFEECHTRCTPVGECHNQNISLSYEVLHKTTCRVKVFTRCKSIHPEKYLPSGMHSFRTGFMGFSQIQWCRNMPSAAMARFLYVSSHLYQKRMAIPQGLLLWELRKKKFLKPCRTIHASLQNSSWTICLLRTASANTLGRQSFVFDVSGQHGQFMRCQDHFTSTHNGCQSVMGHLQGHYRLGTKHRKAEKRYYFGVNKALVRQQLSASIYNCCQLLLGERQCSLGGSSLRCQRCSLHHCSHHVGTELHTSDTDW